jgi:cytochrome c nitrite reductase small subunit
MLKKLAKILAGCGLSYLLAVLLGTLGGAGAYTVYYGEGLSYLSSDPKACVNCHVMREHYDGWQKASHHAAARCVDCHLPDETLPKLLAKAENGFWHSKGFTLQDFHEPIRIHAKNSKILQTNCVRCHQDVVCELIQPEAADPGISCVRCHRQVGHGPLH